MTVIDRKFQIQATNPVNGKSYTEKNAILFCAHDKALPAALAAYQKECQRLGASAEHIESIGLLIERVNTYQRDIGAKVPDTVGKELDSCLAPNAR